ncbi:MAG: PAAR domain-containing protein, partial [Shewanella sp.]
DRTIVTGSSTVFFNGKPAALTGSGISCGGVIIGGSSVNIGDQAPSGTATPMASRSAVAAPPTSEPAAATRPVEIPAQGAYWPPYDFAQGKSLEVIYTAEPSSFAVTSLEEAQEFFSNLYQEMGGKDTVGEFKSGKDLVTGLISATKTAQGLGGLGVKSRIKNINGKDWIIIENFRRHKQTLMRGNKWGANNPKVVQAMMGITSLKGAKTYVKGNPGIEVAFSIGVNAADYILRDEATLVELGVNSAGDMAKGFVATVGAGGLAAAAGMIFGGSILAAGIMFVAAAYYISDSLNSLDTKYGYSKDLTKEIERLIK